MKHPRLPKNIECVPIGSLAPYAGNARIHSPEQIDQIAASIREFGWTSPILVAGKAKKSLQVVAGHGRLLAAAKLGMQVVPIIRLDHLTPTQIRAYIIADNKLTLNAGWEDQTLAAELKALSDVGFDLSLTGFSDDEMKEILGEDESTMSAGCDEPDASKADECQAKWKVKDGDLWILGDHRIACGDSEKLEVWERLLGNDRAQCTFTDPPYGVDYQDDRGTTIANDDLKGDALARLLRESLANCVRHSRDDAAFYIWHASRSRRDFEFALDQVGLAERQYITWVKETFALGRSDYQLQTEPCFYAEKAGNRARWFGERDQSSAWKLMATLDPGNGIALASGLHISDGNRSSLYIRRKKPKGTKARHIRVLNGQSIIITDHDDCSDAWQITRDSVSSYYHPTQKPVELSIIALTNSSQPGDVILEPFSGSGSTLMGAQATGRRCRAIEKEPKYVAVAIERWAIATGETPRREAK